MMRKKQEVLKKDRKCQGMKKQEMPRQEETESAEEERDRSAEEGRDRTVLRLTG